MFFEIAPAGRSPFVFLSLQPPFQPVGKRLFSLVFFFLLSEGQVALRA